MPLYTAIGSILGTYVKPATNIHSSSRISSFSSNLLSSLICMCRRYENARNMIAGLGSCSYRRSIIVYIAGNMDPTVFSFISFKLPFHSLSPSLPSISHAVCYLTSQNREQIAPCTTGQLGHVSGWAEDECVGVKPHIEHVYSHRVYTAVSLFILIVRPRWSTIRTG